MAGITEAGEEKAWQILSHMKPDDVCRAAMVGFDTSRGYKITSYGMEFTASIKDKSITSDAPGSDILLRRLGEFFRLSLLWYLVSAKEIPSTGRLVKLHDIPGGDAFTRGSHVLPLERLARRYGSDKNSFLQKGLELGGTVLTLGDASLNLIPFPRVPVVLTLWLGDDEFPPHADLMFDSTCHLQLPPDIIWSIAMMTVLIMQ